MEVHDAERMQGLPPGWTLTARPGSAKTTGPLTGNGLVTDTDRWRALAPSWGAFPAARWIGAKLASPYAAPFDGAQSAATAFEAAAITPWPSAAFNTGDGHCARVSPFPSAIDVLPTRARSSRRGASGSGSARSAVSKETVLECVDAMRRAGWQPPPPLVAVEVAAHAERTAAGAGAGERAAPGGRSARRHAAAALIPAGTAMPPVYGQMGALAGDPGSAAAAQAAAPQRRWRR